MSASQAFDPTQIFAVFGMRAVDSASFDREVVQAPGDDLRCVFLWGADCYNCNVFKQTAMLHKDALLELGLTWFECNVYDDVALGQRFSLHGVPAFMMFRRGKRLGRISGWPGLPQFAGAVQRLRTEPSAPPAAASTQ
ncbi:thiol reductase thioredoxin [Bordetella genomosp. 10]|uniref:Thiol reductase thioredoxin n=1 Tax=Bordetella genomosp. 10 TaxID=1416804 RepID=A0A261S191_9BORD|nr:thioredoxin family protein [Bordetella genomosp. 10]OZI30921.1 thiol reductase thioredoxin [Bordetella genomosp. 10]